MLTGFSDMGQKKVVSKRCSQIERTSLGALVTGALLLIFTNGCASLDTSAPEGRRSTDSPGLIRSEFLFAEKPTPSCHASTIVETSSGLAAAWFGGTDESESDDRGFG
jgi:hypothetical protein